MNYGQPIDPQWNATPEPYIQNFGPPFYASPVGPQYATTPFAHHALPQPLLPALQNLEAAKCRLQVTQEPSDALMTTHGKEKTRKPLDPPPVVELIVEEDIDPQKLYMNSPNLFMTIQLCPEGSDKPYFSGDNEPTMVGQLCSSVHKLKEGVGEREKGFFIFGDVSVKIAGTWRLRFMLYDLPFPCSRSTCVLLATTFSAPFNVVQSKDYKGLAESTALTRHFSDQGVRLRLRKEQRQSKRKNGEDSPSDLTEATPEDKRARYNDYTDPTDFSAGPVQPHDSGYGPTSLQPLSETLLYNSGQVQTFSQSPPPNPYMTPISMPASRYDERMHDQLGMMLNANNGHNSYGFGTFEH